MLDREDWAQAFESWLAGWTSQNTRTAYRMAWQRLLCFTDKMPWDLERADLLRWVESMQQAGDSNNSICLRLSAIRSFYKDLELLGIQNPAQDIHVKGGSEGTTLTQEQAEALLRAIPKNTLNGKRDTALFLCYLTTGAKGSEIRRLKHKQVLTQGERTWLIWQSPGRNRRELCSPRLREALETYLREPGMAERGGEAYLFTAWPGGRSTERPLSISNTNKLINKYRKMAGLGADITLKVLRNTALEEKRNAYHR
jgi:site-specific recombinase XerD